MGARKGRRSGGRHRRGGAVRVGIATGLVVVGDLIGQGASQEQAVVGETPNLAARLQALAEPGTVVIAPSTRRLTGGLFEYTDLGAVELKGVGALPTRSKAVWRAQCGLQSPGGSIAGNTKVTEAVWPTPSVRSSRLCCRRRGRLVGRGAGLCAISSTSFSMCCGRVARGAWYRTALPRARRFTAGCRTPPIGCCRAETR